MKIEKEIEQLQWMVQELTRRVESLEHMMHTALNKVNTLVLKIRLWEMGRQKKEKEREDG